MEGFRNVSSEQTKQNLNKLIEFGENLQTAIEKRLGNGTQKLEVKLGVELGADEDLQDSVGNLTAPLASLLEMAGMISPGISDEDKRFFIDTAGKFKAGVKDGEIASIIAEIKSRSQKYL